MPKAISKAVEDNKGGATKVAGTAKREKTAEKTAAAKPQPNDGKADAAANSTSEPDRQPLPKARLLFWTVLRQLYGSWKLFCGIALLYGVFNILLVRGLTGSSDLATLKDSLHGLVNGVSGQIAVVMTSFVALMASSGSGNTDVSGVYQSILLVLCSLAFIWALRQTLAGHPVRVRDSFYRGMYPLIPFLLVFMLLALQVVPMALGAGLYSVVSSNGIAVNVWERLVFLLPLILLSLWSLWMATATVFAFYIVTLPDMTPLQAYRSARELVRGRRLLIWRKLIFLLVALFLLGVVIEAPLILLLTPVAAWAFFVLSMAALPIIHGYLYNLYRAML